MIRTVNRPQRMGLVQAGDGGTASAYQFTNGLSNDPQLSYYLQDLTPAQLQVALNGGDPTADLTSLLNQSQTGTGAGVLPCGDPNGPDPNCTGGAPLSAFGLGGILPSVPAWVWIAGAGGLALLLVKR